ncbi:hypothetical protein SAMN05444339_11529 [Loktanella atrilutea]|jgi:hypothetical protein|uniref:Uncharacterized protein n=1 Tax=Loktanella atrilutea TaxID=366533 RepID=A0A1M5EWF9_LOKAT|nr:hypothetical protein [Loktanella atrilutea]SHF83509.1 hypothetical protein SAMN05444339_11529 [Loktanella atrilutea]
MTNSTDEEKKRMALEVMKHYQVLPAGSLVLENVQQWVEAQGWTYDDVLDGFILGREEGLFEMSGSRRATLTLKGAKLH